MDYNLVADNGAFLLSAPNASLAYKPRTLNAFVGAFVLSGSVTGLAHGYIMNSGSGSFYLKSIHAGLLYDCSACCGEGVDSKNIKGQANPLATTETVLYTATKEAKIKSIIVSNQGAGFPASFRISVSSLGGATAAKDYLFFDNPILAKQTIDLDDEIPLVAGDVVRVYASTANFSFNLFGTEKK